MPQGPARFPIAVPALLLGLAAFAIQAADGAWTRTRGLNSKAAHLVHEGFSQLLATPQALAWLGYYLAWGVALHVFLAAAMLKAAADLRRLAPAPLAPVARQRGLGVLATLLAVAALRAIDRAFWPGGLAGPEAGPEPALVVLAAALALLVLVFLAAWAWVRWRAPSPVPAPRRWPRLALAVAALALLGPGQAPATGPARRAPDIIVLGVDSLRPDHLATFGAPASPAPTVDALLARAVVFEQATTPMARTFVAYSALLSGQYPTTNGVRENLFPRARIHATHWLPARLRRQGYRTVLAIDESRFANFSGEFGLDAVVAPPSGIVDLMATTLTDVPAMNLAQRLPGAWRWWPHLAGNRAQGRVFEPLAAVDRIAAATAATPPGQPLFLAAHFTLPHLPFAHGAWPKEPLPPAYADSPAHYRKALALADAQVRDLLAALRRQGRLDNAIVVVLSDHGEGLGMAKDAWTPAEGHADPVPQARGHGNSALDPSQIRVVLGFLRFKDGRPAWLPARTPAPASLVDLAPTLVGLLEPGRPLPEGFDGLALVDPDGRPVAPPGRPVFVESGMDGASLRARRVDEARVANEFASFYRITDDLRFELTPSALGVLLPLKRRAVWQGHRALGTEPAGRGWVLVDVDQGTRTRLDDPWARADTAALAALVCEHFAGDPGFSAAYCPASRSGSLAAGDQGGGASGDREAP